MYLENLSMRYVYQFLGCLKLERRNQKQPEGCEGFVNTCLNVALNQLYHKIYF